MSDENDIILEEGEESSQMIQDQLDIITTLDPIDLSNLYEDFNEHKIRAIVMAFKIINKLQSNVFKSLRW